MNNLAETNRKYFAYNLQHWPFLKKSGVTRVKVMSFNFFVYEYEHPKKFKSATNNINLTKLKTKLEYTN